MASGISPRARRAVRILYDITGVRTIRVTPDALEADIDFEKLRRSGYQGDVHDLREAIENASACGEETVPGTDVGMLIASRPRVHTRPFRAEPEGRQNRERLAKLVSGIILNVDAAVERWLAELGVDETNVQQHELQVQPIVTAERKETKYRLYRSGALVGEMTCAYRTRSEPR